MKNYLVSKSGNPLRTFMAYSDAEVLLSVKPGETVEEVSLNYQIPFDPDGVILPHGPLIEQ